MEPTPKTPDFDVPQWKKDLIARLRNQNKRSGSPAEQHGQQLSNNGNSPPRHSPPRSSSTSAAVVRGAGQQPSLTCNSSNEAVVASSSAQIIEKCNVYQSPTCSPVKSKMVQDKPWFENVMVTEKYTNGLHRRDSDSDSSEDLSYGPGIVNKLKNKYLSLALRENASRSRPSILRKATSLENMLDDDVPNGTSSTENRLFASRLNGSNDTAKNVPNRYRNAARGLEMKRARSVEAISLSHHHDDHIPSVEVRPDRKSLHEDMLITEGNDEPYRKMYDKIIKTANENNKYANVGRINRPKRIAPIMNDKEKPPADVVKQKKMIFERRPESRTKAPISTGDVAAKVDTYNSIIGKTKSSKKPLIKHKPVLNNEKKPSPPVSRVAKPVIINNDDQVINNKTSPKKLDVNKVPKPALNDNKLLSPIPDVSRIDPSNNKSEKDNALSETPDLILTLVPTSPTHKKTTEKFIENEILNNSTNGHSFYPTSQSSPKLPDDVPDSPGIKRVSPTSLNNITKSAETAVFNFANTQVDQSHLPVNKNVSNKKTPPSQPLQIEVNGFCNPEVRKASPKPTPISKDLPSPKLSPIPKLESIAQTPNPPQPKVNLTTTEIEKNLKNTAKTQQQAKPASVSAISNGSAEVSKVVVPKVKRTKEPVSTTSVFNFTNRKDVPDYISNDTSRNPGRPELPKVILLRPIFQFV